MEKVSNPVVERGEPVPRDEVRAERVLVVEDQRHLSRFLHYVLEQAGYNVSVAFDGEQALSAIEKFRPDAVLLDFMLPGISGMEVLRRVRSDRRDRDLVIVMLLGNCCPEFGMVVRSAGASAHCNMPIAPAALLEKLDELLALSRSEHQAPRTLAPRE